MGEAGASVVHCPTSNNFLGSGLFRYHRTRNGAHPVTVGIGCDIGGGTSYSMLATMRDAYVVSQLSGARITAFDAFYLATLGNAQLLHLDHEIGMLEPGFTADIAVLDPQATPLMAARHELSQSLHDVLFALDDHGRRPGSEGNLGCRQKDEGLKVYIISVHYTASRGRQAWNSNGTRRSGRRFGKSIG